MGCNSYIIKISDTGCSTNPSGDNWKQISVNKIVILPFNYENIKSVNSVNLRVNIISANLIQSPDSMNIPNCEGTYLTGLKVLVTGEIIETINYTTEKNCKVCNFKNTECFSDFVVLDPNYDVNKQVCVSACIDGGLLKLIDNRTIQKSVGVFIEVN